MVALKGPKSTCRERSRTVPFCSGRIICAYATSTTQWCERVYHIEGEPRKTVSELASYCNYVAQSIQPAWFLQEAAVGDPARGQPVDLGSM